MYNIEPKNLYLIPEFYTHYKIKVKAIAFTMGLSPITILKTHDTLFALYTLNHENVIVYNESEIEELLKNPTISQIYKYEEELVLLKSSEKNKFNSNIFYSLEDWLNDTYHFTKHINEKLKNNELKRIINVDDFLKSIK